MGDLWLWLTSPAYIPFTTTLFIMVGIGLIEAIGLGIGSLPDVHADLNVHCDVGTPTVLDWLGLGSGMPILIWLTSLLACFSICGFMFQMAGEAIFGHDFSTMESVVVALLCGFIVNTIVAQGLHRILPKDETSALHPDDLILLTGEVVTTYAGRGHPSRVKLVDRFQQAHFVPIEPHDDIQIPVGESVLLVRRVGSIYYVVPSQPSSFLTSN